MDKYDKAEKWAKEQIEKGLDEPIRLSSFETITHPTEYLKTCVARLRHSSQIEAELAYTRIYKLAKLLKNKI